MKFVLFHGAFGSPYGNWLPELRAKLEALGQEVIVPQFSVDSWDEVTKAGDKTPLKYQALANWLAIFEPIAKSFNKDEKLCFVGHSLGPLFILHVVVHFDLYLDSAIFVSPFLDKLNKSWQIDYANDTFYKTDFDFEKLKKRIPISYVLYSDDDPYVDKNHSILFAKALDSSLIYVKKAGHMNSEVNLNEFPLIFDLCATRLDLSLYQRYLLHRKEMDAVDFIGQGKIKGMIRLPADHATDEGIFHFTHLQKSGFCTLFTGIQYYWDPHSQYMEDARRAAKRIGNVTRVIVLEKIEDINNPVLREQIALDLASGITVFLCMYDDIKKAVAEPDFGIWDEDYVCIVRFDKEKKHVREIELNSKTFDMNKAFGWKAHVLKYATQIRNSEQDIAKFVAAHR